MDCSLMSEGVSKNSKAKKKRAVLCIVSLRLLKNGLKREHGTRHGYSSSCLSLIIRYTYSGETLFLFYSSTCPENTSRKSFHVIFGVALLLCLLWSSLDSGLIEKMESFTCSRFLVLSIKFNTYGSKTPLQVNQLDAFENSHVRSQNIVFLIPK